jgi:hypothetical protein
VVLSFIRGNMRFRLPSPLVTIVKPDTASSNDVDTLGHDFAQKQPTGNDTGLADDPGLHKPEGPAGQEGLQHGVVSVEAMTEVWTKRNMMIAYTL